MTDKNVCILTQEYQRGATWICSEKMAEELQQIGTWTPYLVSALRDAKLTPVVEHDVINVKLINTSSSKFFYTRNYWKKSASVIRSINPLLIHGNMPMLSTRGLEKDRPIVETVHTTFFGEKESIKAEPFFSLNWVEKRIIALYPLFKRIEQKLLSRADHLLAVSESIKDELISFYKIDESLVTVVPNGVNIDVYFKDKEKLYTKQHDEFVIGFLGRLMARKGALMLLPMLKKLKEEIPKIKFLFAGDDINNRKWFLNQARQLNLEDSLVFFGYIDDNLKNAFFSSLDLFLLPSNYEGMNLTLLEAMACQTPILVAPETVTFDHFDSIFVAPRTVNDFVDTILNLHKNQELLEKAALKARTVAQKYSWKNTAIETQKIYDSLI